MFSFILRPLWFATLFAVINTGKSGIPHPLHVSTSDINYNGQDGKLEITCTLFTDDFEQAIEKQYHTKTDLSRADMHTAMDALIQKYINTHLIVKSGTMPVNLNYLGFEIDHEATNVYLESGKLPVVKKEIADVSLLYNLFTDQINIVHMTVGGVRKSTKIGYPTTRVVQDF